MVTNWLTGARSRPPKGCGCAPLSRAQLPEHCQGVML
jgi:hypothetical protein